MNLDKAKLLLAANLLDWANELCSTSSCGDFRVDESPITEIDANRILDDIEKVDNQSREYESTPVISQDWLLMSYLATYLRDLSNSYED